MTADARRYEPVRPDEEHWTDLVPCGCSFTHKPSCPDCHDGNGVPTRWVLRGTVPSHPFEYVLEGPA